MSAFSGEETTQTGVAPPLSANWVAYVLCLAPQEGLGVRDQELREKHLPAINRFRNV